MLICPQSFKSFWFAILVSVILYIIKQISFSVAYNLNAIVYISVHNLFNLERYLINILPFKSM